VRALQARGTGIETPILHFLYFAIRMSCCALKFLA
jgi:hypothetical protein